MQFENLNIQNLISQYKAFSVEGFNLFGTGEDDLPHLISACPNKQFARAIQSLLTIAKRAQNFQVVDADITSHCYLAPMLLANGTLALVATVIDDAVWKDGKAVEYDEAELHLGSLEYQNFAAQFFIALEEVDPPRDSTSQLHVYEDTITKPASGKDEFPY